MDKNQVTGEKMNAMPKITIDFMDGSQESFEVQKPDDYVTARRARLDMFLEGRFMIVEEDSLENAVHFFPIENIKCIRVEGSPAGLELPPYAVRRAKRVLR